jgi:hypothetical protein
MKMYVLINNIKKYYKIIYFLFCFNKKNKRKMMMLLKFIFIWSLKIRKFSSVEYDCIKLNSSISKESFFDRYFVKYLALKIKDFDDFGEINVECNETFKNIFILELIPNKKQILDNKFNLSSLNIEFKKYPAIFISNLYAIDLKTSSNFGFNFKSKYNCQNLNPLLSNKLCDKSLSFDINNNLFISLIGLSL